MANPNSKYSITQRVMADMGASECLLRKRAKLSSACFWRKDMVLLKSDVVIEVLLFGTLRALGGLFGRGE